MHKSFSIFALIKHNYRLYKQLIKRQMKKLLYLGLGTMLFTGCGLNELMEKTNKMTETIQANCDCDDVRLLSYEENGMGTVTVYFEVVGTDTEKHIETAEIINT